MKIKDVLDIRAILAGLVLILAACAPPSSPTPGSTPAPASTPAPDQTVTAGPVKPPLIETEAACKSYGGDWRPICMLQKPACVVTFQDAGKSCSNSSECSGRCEATGNPAPESAVRGVCSRNSDPCGCFQLVENGKAGYPLCAD